MRDEPGPAPLPVNPARAALGVSLARVALGATLLAAPRAATRRAIRGYGPSEEAVDALRMLAGRDLAIGLGGLIAARRSPRAARGWLEAGALADAIDAWALARSTAIRRPARAAGALIAAAAAGAAMMAARRLSDPAGPEASASGADRR